MLCKFIKIIHFLTLFGAFSDCAFIRSANELTLPLESNDVQLQGNIEHRTCDVGREEYSGLSFHKLDCRSQTVEPRTGIEFPMLLKKNASGFTSEVLIAFPLHLLFFGITTHVRVSDHSQQ